MGNTSIIPDVLIRPTGLVPGDALRETAPDVAAQQTTVAASGTPLALLYGRVRIGAKVTQPVPWGIQLLVPCLLGLGPIEGVEAVEFDDKPAPAGVTWTIYTGAAGQGIDPWLQTAWAIQGKTYADTLPGIAYIVLRIPNDSEVSFDSISFIVKGLKVFDPRSRSVVVDSTIGKHATLAATAFNRINTETRLWLEFVGALDSWTTQSISQVLVSKWTTANPNACCEFHIRNTDGALLFAWCPAGDPSSFLFFTGLATCPLLPGQFGGLAVDVNLSDAGAKSAQFYYSTDGIVWIALGAKVTIASTSAFSDSGVAKWQVGGRSAGGELLNIVGRMHRASAKKGAGQTEIMRFDPRIAAIGATAWTSGMGVGEDWTLAGGLAVSDDVNRWSVNPTLATAHFLNALGIGAEEAIDWTSVGSCADINDQLCGTGSQLEKRRTLGLTLDQQQEVGAIEELLRAHAGCWIVREGGVVRLVADAPASSIFHFVAGKYRLDSMSLTKRGQDNAPTVVIIKWTDTTVRPWREVDTDPLKAAGVDAGTTPWVESAVPMPGIQQPGQAYRETVRRMNEWVLSDLKVSFIAMDEGAKVMKGDVFQFTDFEGLTGKTFRCNEAYPLELGRWRIEGDEYNAGVYSDSPANGPGTPDTTLPDPRVVDAPTVMVITETIYLEKNIAPDSIARGLIYQSRFDVTVTAPIHAYPFQYEWEVWDGTVKVHEAITATAALSTPAVQQGKSYTVKCRARNVIGARSSYLIDTKIALGKLLAPGPIPSIIRSFEAGGKVFLEWTPAVDIDVERYEWRFTPNLTGGGSWETATLIDRVDGLRADFSGLAIGTHRFYGKAIDSVGNYSTSAITVDITVTTDADAFLQEHEFTNPFIADGSELIVNGDFSSATGWTTGGGWSIGSGKLTATAAVNTGTRRQDVVLVTGALYRVVITVDSISGASAAVNVILGSGGQQSTPITAPGTYTFLLTALSSRSDNWVYVYAIAGTVTAQVDNFSMKECFNIVALPQIEGVWKQRWATSVPGATWNQSITGTVNSVATPVIQQHFADSSRFIGESWDLGNSLSGDWSLTPNHTVINGTVNVAIEASPDGTNWTRFVGTTFKGAARVVRAVIDAIGAATFVVNAPPKIKLAALARNESGQTTTLGSGGKLIQLAGLYSIVQDLQATAINQIGGSVTARTCVADRILVHPQTGLMLSYNFNGSGDNYEYRSISTASRVVASGDYIEFDVYIDPANPPPVGSFSNGGLFIHFTDATDNGAQTDTDGLSMVAPYITFDPLARGAWKSRKSIMTAFVGKTINNVVLSNHGDAVSGTAKVLYRNIRITDGAGVLRQQYWASGEPAANTDYITNLVTNVQCGPSNSFLLYAFNSADGVQVASDAQWSFKGL